MSSVGTNGLRREGVERRTNVGRTEETSPFNLWFLFIFIRNEETESIKYKTSVSINMESALFCFMHLNLQVTEGIYYIHFHRTYAPQVFHRQGLSPTTHHTICSLTDATPDENSSGSNFSQASDLKKIFSVVLLFSLWENGCSSFKQITKNKV